jgi:bifunctional non-homologous end joining protein LigD
MVQRVARNPKPRPRFIEPMERQRVARLPEGDEWLYEPKQDGYRIIAVIDGSTTLLHSMSGLNYTAKYPHIAEALKWLKLREAVFDGEVVALDASGRPNFQELQNARLTKLPIVYFIFDVLHLHGHDLLDRPLSERRRQLEELAVSFADPLRLNPSFQVPLAAFTAQVRKLGLEGSWPSAPIPSTSPARNRTPGASTASIRKMSS